MGIFDSHFYSTNWKELIAARPLCTSYMVGGLFFALNHPTPYLIIVGLCKTHPTQIDTDTPSKPMQVAPSNGGAPVWAFFVSGDSLAPRYPVTRTHSDP